MVLLGLFALFLLAQQPTPLDALAVSAVERAQNQLNAVKALVAEGTLPMSRQKEAEENLADAQDQATLARTLYSQTRLEDMTAADGNAMLEAAEHRVSRQQLVVDDRRGLLSAGILAKSEFDRFTQELLSRQRVLDLARNRLKLLDELKAMAETERRAERAAAFGTLKNSMIRYDGSAPFNLAGLPAISTQFERRFHRPLPVSALGQTMLHRSMGLDHRNRVDVALNPDGLEGLWLRKLLERLHISYLAFRSAVPGAATAPHIHIGSGSSRLLPGSS